MFAESVGRPPHERMGPKGEKLSPSRPNDCGGSPGMAGVQCMLRSSSDPQHPTRSAGGRKVSKINCWTDPLQTRAAIHPPNAGQKPARGRVNAFEVRVAPQYTGSGAPRDSFVGFGEPHTGAGHDPRWTGAVWSVLWVGSFCFLRVCIGGGVLKSEPKK